MTLDSPDTVAVTAPEEPSKDAGLAKPSPYALLFNILAGILILVAVFFRVWRLGNVPGVNGDEAYFGIVSQSILQHKPVQWVTPNGNPDDIFYVLPSLLLHVFFSPSPLLLRTPAVISGILAIGVVGWFWSKIYGRAVAVASALLIAVLPEDIMQSRFGWEPSQSVLLTSISLYCSLMMVVDEARPSRRLTLAVVAFLAAILCHPTNIFIAVFLAGAILARYKAQIARAMNPKVSGPKAYGTWAGVVIVVCGLLVWRWSLVAKGLSALADTNTVIAFPIFFARLMDGITALRYVTASWYSNNTPESAINAVTYPTLAVIVIAALYGLFRSFIAKDLKNQADKVLFGSWILMVIAFLLIGGTQALLPGNERYGLFLIAPTVLMVCRAFYLAVGPIAPARRVLAAALLVVSASLLLMFYRGYFDMIEHVYVVPSPTFLTGTVEPKEAVWKIIGSQNTQRDEPGAVVCASWQTVYTLRYLNTADPNSNLIVMPASSLDDRSVLASMTPAFQAGRVWFVQYGMFLDSGQRRADLKASSWAYTEQTVYGYKHLPVLVVFHVTGPKASVNGSPPKPATSH